jgi:predicted permease
MFSDLRYRLRALFKRSALEQELDDELRFHVERETEKYVREGLSRADAERRAHLAFGGMDRIKDDTRDARGVARVESIGQDLRYAWRGLRAKPGFTAAVVVALGLGVGANTMMFGIVDRLLFRPPPYLADADRVHRVYMRYIWNGDENIERSMSYLRYTELASLASSFDRVAAFARRELAIGTGVESREMTVAPVSAAYFDFFDAPPAIGRYFTRAEDTTPAGANVAVLGYGLWQSRFAGRNDALGQTIKIGSQVFTIIGVAPEGFVGVEEGRAPAAFIPITTYASSRGTGYYRNHNWGWMEMLVRRKPGLSTSAANGDLSAAYARSWNLEAMPAGKRLFLPADSAHARVEVASIHLGRGPDAGPDARIVTWVMGVAAIVLLVACANVANLLLARAVRRRREIALRLALGVTRGRLLQQLLTESLLLASFGGIAGLAAAQWGGNAVRALFLRAEDAGAVVTDARTLLFAGGITVLVAVLTGLAPALHTIRGSVADSLKGGQREGQHRSRLRTGLLLFQGALSVVLLVGAGLFVRSLSNVRSMRLGYDVDPTVVVSANLRGTQLNDAQRNALADQIAASALTVPGVQAASATVSVPFWSFEGRGAPFALDGVDSTAKLGSFILQTGSPDYFAASGTRIVRGRGFTRDDRATGLPIVVVSESMAAALWPGKDAIGQRMRVDSDTMPFLTVVGIAEDLRGRRLVGNREFWYYVPLEQYKRLFGSVYPQLIVRVNGRAEDFVEPLRRRLQQDMPGDAYVGGMPLRRLVAPQQRSWQFGATMFAAFGALALLLAAIGLYSVIAYAVAQRTHELGVRIALGASVRQVVGMIVGQGVTITAIGIAIGSAIALWASRWVEPLLFAQRARDPLVFGSVALILLLVAIAATVRPAFRATRVDPTVALRSD